MAKKMGAAEEEQNWRCYVRLVSRAELEMLCVGLIKQQKLGDVFCVRESCLEANWNQFSRWLWKKQVGIVKWSGSRHGSVNLLVLRIYVSFERNPVLSPCEGKESRESMSTFAMRATIRTR